jgi:hypothetical protein
MRSQVYFVKVVDADNISEVNAKLNLLLAKSDVTGGLVS